VISISRLYCGASDASDVLRYGADPGQRRDPFAADSRPVVVWNCTRRCNLRCIHCYSRSADRPFSGRMATDEGYALLADLAEFGTPVVLFSGGEPLLRPDLDDLARRAIELGLRAVVSTNGTLLDRGRAETLRDIGLSYVGVSLDGMREANDRFRGVEGAFDAALAGIRNCLDAGLKVGLRFTISRRNIADLPDIFRLVGDEGIPRACFYHLVYSGRASRLAGEALDCDETRRAVDTIMDLAAALHAGGAQTQVLTVDNHADGPHVYLRMVREGRPGAADALRLLLLNGGSASGRRIACVSWDGSVHPDQFWRDVVFGNVRERPFSDIWLDLRNPLLAKLKDPRPHLKGRCATCRFINACAGGLRARAEAATGDPWQPDPACYLTPEETAGEPETLDATD